MINKQIYNFIKGKVESLSILNVSALLDEIQLYTRHGSFLY